MFAGGCATSPERPPTQEELLRRSGIDPAIAPDPLAITEEMRAEAERLVGHGTDRFVLDRLQAALFDEKKFPFEYGDEQTLTAAEALAQRRGNCVSFTALFIAMGQALGVPVRPALVPWARDSSHEGDFALVQNHIVAVHLKDSGLRVYDFNEQRDGRPIGIQLLDDRWLRAIFLNNRGAEALRQDRPERAAELFAAAVALAPEYVAAYANLGVALRRAGNTKGAFAAYSRALDVAPDDPSVLNNLAVLYQGLGRPDQAREAVLAGSLDRALPHQLTLRAAVERDAGNLEEARRLYRRAWRMDKSQIEPLLGLARLELARGRTEEAGRWLRRAMELAPNDERTQALQQIVERR
jgi:Flp pilus assembly protein TadD